MRLIHTSDWHLGRSLHGEDLLPHAEAFLDWLLELATAGQTRADAIIVAGDVYDRAIPPVEAVRLLDRAVSAFAEKKIPMVITGGNHDSAVRLGFGRALSESAGIHLRTSLDDLTRPILVADAFGPVAVYGMPYLLPDAVMGELDADRAHSSVLAKATERVRHDAAARGLDRVVLVGHALVTGATKCESERDIRVGGVADVPTSVFDGFCYVALGHLHRAQVVRDRTSAAGGTTISYSGSPLPLSFSEKAHTKSVTVVDIAADGTAKLAHPATPVPRPMREVKGELEDLLARADGELAELAQAWVRVVLTDRVRPTSPMDRLRAKWPHTLDLDFEPAGGVVDTAADLAKLAETTDPLEICKLFVEFVTNAPPDPEESAVLRAAVEAAQHAEGSE